MNIFLLYFMSEHMLYFFQTLPRQAHLKRIILGASILSKQILWILHKVTVKYFKNIRGQVYTKQDEKNQT